MPGGRAVVELVVPAAEAELAADALWQAGASAVGEAPGPAGHVRLTADVDDPSLVRGPWPVTTREVDEEAHLDAWRAFAGPVRAGPHVLLWPAWVPDGPRGPDDLVVPLDPGRAFGSGSHPATRLVVAALEDHPPAGATVLDVGCGSGVLAIVALRLGAARAVAIDVDPAAVTATTANARANGVADRLLVSTTPLADLHEPFDVVVANIGVRVLQDHAADLEARVAPDGLLVLSGLLEGQADATVACYPGCDELERRREDGWAAPVLRRR